MYAGSVSGECLVLITEHLYFKHCGSFVISNTETQMQVTKFTIHHSIRGQKRSTEPKSNINNVKK
jgi:hypothetical protein